MAGFSVDSDAVKILARRIADVGSELGAATAPSELAEAQVGSHEIADALVQFHAHWARERDSLTRSLDALARTVSNAADDYARSDQAIATAAHTSSGVGTDD